MWPAVGALVSAGLSYYGGQQAQKSQQDINSQNVANQQAINAQNLAYQREAQAIATDQFNQQMGFSREQWNQNVRDAASNIDLQKQFAQQGIRWKVADATAAGLHPLYAMGGQTMSFAPVSVGGTSIPGSSLVSPAHASAAELRSSSAAGQGLANAGQDIGRAINATRTQDERVAAAAMAGLSLERAHLENDLLRSQIAKNNSASNPPMAGSPYLLEGQTQSGSPVKDAPLKRIAGPEGQPGSEPGAITDVGYARTATGWAPVPSNDVKERIEDNLIQETLHAIRNNVLPTIGINRQPPPFKAPAGQYWSYNPYRQEYQLRQSRDSHGWQDRVNTGVP